MSRFLQGVGSEFCDVTLMLEGTPIPAHRAILVARSAYFKGLFRSFAPSDKTVEVQQYVQYTCTLNCEFVDDGCNCL